VWACGRVGVATSLVMRNFYKPQEAGRNVSAYRHVGVSAWLIIAGNAQFLPTSGGLTENVSAYRRAGVAYIAVMRNFCKPQEA
jgi:hypothetical protein